MEANWWSMWQFDFRSPGWKEGKLEAKIMVVTSKEVGFLHLLQQWRGERQSFANVPEWLLVFLPILLTVCVFCTWRVLQGKGKASEVSRRFYCNISKSCRFEDWTIWDFSCLQINKPRPHCFSRIFGNALCSFLWKATPSCIEMISSCCSWDMLGSVRVKATESFLRHPGWYAWGCPWKENGRVSCSTVDRSRRSLLHHFLSQNDLERMSWRDLGCSSSP